MLHVAAATAGTVASRNQALEGARGKNPSAIEKTPMIEAECPDFLAIRIKFPFCSESVRDPGIRKAYF